RRLRSSARLAGAPEAGRDGEPARGPVGSGRTRLGLRLRTSGHSASSLWKDGSAPRPEDGPPDRARADRRRSAPRRSGSPRRTLPRRGEGMPERREPSIRVVLMPKDTNAHGTIFGGVILSYIDQAGAVEAKANGADQIVTIAMREVVFHEP